MPDKKNSNRQTKLITNINRVFITFILFTFILMKNKLAFLRENKETNEEKMKMKS